MSWYKVIISASPQDSIEEQFEKIFIAIQDRKGMALFCSGASPASGMLSYYFTPACESHPAMRVLMESLGAVPCDEPTKETEDELGLRRGDVIRWRAHTWCPDSP